MAWISSCIESVIILFLIGTAGGVALERLQPRGERVDTLEARDQPAPDMSLFERNAPGVYAGAGNGMADHGTAGDDHVVADRQVSADAHLAADHATAANARAARDSHAGRQCAVGANPYVVRDHDQVVELHALLDHRVIDGSAVDRGVGANLDVGADTYGACLRHLDPTTAFLSEPEAVAADYGPRLDHGSGPDLDVMTYRHPRREAH